MDGTRMSSDQYIWIDIGYYNDYTQMSCQFPFILGNSVESYNFLKTDCTKIIKPLMFPATRSDGVFQASFMWGGENQAANVV